MGLFGTSNRNISNQITQQGSADFKAVNNLLTLQENHVEEFFTYHGEPFLGALEQLMEDVIERAVSRLMIKLKFQTDTNGNLSIHPDSLRDFEQVTDANIQLDLQTLLASALNSEVILQRKMAKQQYLESQGYATQQQANVSSAMNMGTPMNTGAPMMNQGMPNAGGLNPSEISGGNPMIQANNMMMQQQQAFNNPSGYPIAPSGYDSMNNPYWIDPQTGQPTYTPPGSGLGLSSMIQKGAAWAAWLA